MPVLCWYFFNLNEIVIVKKENISSILIAKMYEINFYHQCLQTYIQGSLNSLFEPEKVFQIIDIVL